MKSGLVQSYTTPEIQGYDQIIKLVAIIRELLANPPDLHKATMDALATISEAKTAAAKLEENAALLQATHQATSERLDAKSRATENKMQELRIAQKDHDGKSIAHERAINVLEAQKSDVETRHAKVASLEQNMGKLQGEIAKRETALLAREAVLTARDKALTEKHEMLTTKEAALRQLLG